MYICVHKCINVRFFIFLLYYRTRLIRILKFIVLISVSTHFVACIWYLLGCNVGKCNSGTWAAKAGKITWTIYIISCTQLHVHVQFRVFLSYIYVHVHILLIFVHIQFSLEFSLFVMASFFSCRSCEYISSRLSPLLY